MAAKLTEKAKEFLNKALETLKGVPSAAWEAASHIHLPKAVNSLADRIADRFLGHFPEEKRRPIVYIAAGLVVFLLILIISVAAVESSPKDVESADMVLGPYIPPEELFIPAEPEFVPDYLSGREPRLSWSVDDIRPYWRNPSGDDMWREEIKTTVDRLMDGVQ